MTMRIVLLFGGLALGLLVSWTSRPASPKPPAIEVVKVRQVLVVPTPRRVER